MTRFTALSTRLFTTAFLLVVGAPTPYAQTPLDVRILNERLDRIEQTLQNAQSGTVTPAMQMPSVPSEAGTQQQSLPPDVAGRLQVRILQLERLVETLTGQMEETRFEITQMRAQLQQMSNDVSYRLAVLEQAAGISSAVAAAPGATFTLPTTGAAMPSPLPTPGQVPQQAAAPSTGQSIGPDLGGRIAPDLSMPMSAPVQPQPQIIGQAQPQPQNLGQVQPMTGGTPSQPPQSAAGLAGQAPAGTVILAPGETLTAPVQAGPVNQGNTFGVVRTDDAGNPLPPSPATAQTAGQLPPQQQAAVPPPPRVEAAPSPGPVASTQIGRTLDPVAAMTQLPQGTPQEQYDYAFDILRRADYGRAETALRMFLEANPDDTLAGNAQYWLGETFYVRGDFEQAAVEFLSGYQTYPSSNKAPDNLLKLGLSMARLGQTDGACTALGRLATEYPDANDTIRRRAQTERARLSCG